MDTNNPVAFSEECFQFNNVIPLDKWKLNVLNRIKERLSPQKGIAGEEEGGYL